MEPLAFFRGTARAVLGAALAALTGCTTLPPYSTEIGDVIAHANDPARAADLARRGWEQREAVTSRLPGAIRGSVLLVEQDPGRMPGPYAHGYTETPDFGAQRGASGRRIFLRATADPAVLTHELVHASLGAAWRALPPVLEEGLADHVAFQVHPESYLQVERWQAAVWRDIDVQVEHVLALGEWREAGSFILRLSPGSTEPPFGPEESLTLPASLAFGTGAAESGNRFYGLGFAMVERLVERIGLEGLYRVARDTRAAGTERLSTEDLRTLLGGGSDLLPPVWLEQRLDEALERSLLDFPELRDLVRDRFVRARTMRPGIAPEAFAAALSLRVSVDDDFWRSWRELPGYAELVDELADRTVGRP